MTARRARWLALLAVAIAIAGWGVGAFLDREAPREVVPAPDVPPPEPAPPEKVPKPLDPKDRAKLVDLFRQYLDKRSAQAFEARISILEALKRQRATGVDLLADPDTLQEIVYAARPYEPFFERRMLPPDAKHAEIAVDPASGIVNVSWDALRLSLSLPTGYAHLAEVRRLPETPPYPAIVTLHESEDYEDSTGRKKFPGMEVLRRRWSRDDPALRPVLDGWFVFAPVATRAQFIQDGRLRPDRVPLEELWRRYHVDLDRIVLEGGTEALTFAAAQPNYLAGVIVRGATADIDKEVVRNVGHLPVYVVGDAPAVKTLAAGGHPASLLTTGPLQGLPAWLGKLPRRAIPRDFHWTVKDPDVHTFAHWINLEVLDPTATNYELRVRCLDTKEDPNTVRIDCAGVVEITAFLSDQLVDLDRPVRLVVNGEVVTEARTPSNFPGGRVVTLPGRLERSLDTIFDHETVDVRGSLYFGWWSPVSLNVITATGDGRGVRRQAWAQQAAEGYYRRAVGSEKDGRNAEALGLFRKAVAAGDTTVRALAEAKVKELEARGASSSPAR
jgi:hypothetical protein